MSEYTKPLPVSSVESKPFWDGCKNRQFILNLNSLNFSVMQFRMENIFKNFLCRFRLFLWNGKTNRMFT